MFQLTLNQEVTAKRLPSERGLPLKRFNRALIKMKQTAAKIGGTVRLRWFLSMSLAGVDWLISGGSETRFRAPHALSPLTVSMSLS